MGKLIDEMKLHAPILLHSHKSVIRLLTEAGEGHDSIIVDELNRLTTCINARQQEVNITGLNLSNVHV